MWRLTGLLALFVAFLALTVGSASAAQTHVFKEAFGSAGSGDGQFNLAANSGLAVDDETGDVYLADTGNHRVDEFSSAGAFIRAFGADVGGPGVDVCTTGCVAGTAGTAPGQLEAPTFVAIDNDGASASHGDVYVADTADHLVTKFDSEGNLISSWGNNGLAEAPNGQLAGKTQAEPFKAIAGIAVDTAGDLDLLQFEPELVFRFAPDGSFLTDFENPRGNAQAGLAVDASGNFYKVNGNLSVEKFEGHEPPNDIGQVASEGTQAKGVAVDPSEAELFVDEAGGQIGAYAFTPSGEVRGTGCAPAPAPFAGCPTNDSFGAGHLAAAAGLAVDTSTHTVFAADPGAGRIVAFESLPLPDATTEAATAVGVHEAILHGTISAAAGPAANCEFQYTTRQAFESAGFQGAQSASCSPSGPFSGSGSEAVSAAVGQLAAGTEYIFRLIASNENGSNPKRSSRFGALGFETSGPLIAAESVSGVSATAATLETELNPHGLPTTYRFEYDTVPYTEGGSAHGTSTPTDSAGSGTTDVTRTAPIQGLTPNTIYHFRVVAENVLGTSFGPDRSFTTQGAAATLLPDSRAWELVSPPDKHGAPLEGLTFEGGVIQAAADGSALAYISNGPVGTEAEGNRSVTFSQLLTRREGPGAWSTRDVSTSHQAPAGISVGHDSEYDLFSTSLSSAAVEPEGQTPLSPSSTSRTPYLRSDFSGAGFCAGVCYRPLITGCPEAPAACPPAVEQAANVPPGTKFGEFGVFATATPDLSHVVLKSQAALVPGFENGGEPAVYQWSGGNLTPISALPDGAPAGQAEVGREGRQIRNAISADGSRVVFEAGSPSSLYLRANATGPQSASGACDEAGRACTIQLDAAEPNCLTCQSGGGIFQIASADDSRVFFTDGSRLTESSTATNGSPDLYMCQIEEPQPGHLACELTDLTANTVDPAEPAAILGAVIGAAADGSSVYFVAQGALTEGEGAVSGDCNGSLGSGACNLYRYDVATATTRLVAVLSGQDGPDWASNESGKNLGYLTARVSPNGRYLAFMSQRSLTGYDNRDAKTDARDQEVYLYDSAAGSGSGLACASCNPTGARPHGVFDAGVFPGLLVDRAGSVSTWEGQTLAANIPGWTKYKLGAALYQSRYLSDSGRLFFNAADALVPADTDGTFDVYEFEYPQGPGQPESNTCTTTSSTYSPRSGGCVSLISSGTSPEESAFLDASETGNDVFFLTASRLTAKDEDKALDVYDARVGGGEPEVVRPVECSGDACQQPAVPPNDATPGSLTFNGAGNVLECSKGKVKKNGKCVQKKAKKKSNGHKKKHSNKKHKRGSAK